jgi:hypothetical protein
MGSRLEWIFRRSLARRRLGCRIARLPGRQLARHHGQPIDRCRPRCRTPPRPNFGALEIEVTVDDPKAYTKPWTVTMHQKIVLDTAMIDLICLQNNKDLAHMKP